MQGGTAHPEQRFAAILPLQQRPDLALPMQRLPAPPRQRYASAMQQGPVPPLQRGPAPFRQQGPVPPMHGAQVGQIQGGQKKKISNVKKNASLHDYVKEKLKVVDPTNHGSYGFGVSAAKEETRFIAFRHQHYSMVC